MNYKETMDYIQNTAKFSKRNGLDRIEKILEQLGNPHLELRCIHIAGTNGKGSTTAMISSVLKAQGFKVGMYTSPYLEEFEERIQVNGINISKERLCDIISKVSKAVECVIVMGYDPPTEFEIITAAMFLYYKEEAVDFAVIEVGLGGRLDPTNVITPIVSVITSISYDHMAILGNSLKEIAYEKAGIIKPTVPVVSYPQQEDAAEVIEKTAKDKGSEITKVSVNSGKLIRVEGKYQHISIKTELDSYKIKLALLGEVQIYNCAVAIHTIENLIKSGIKIDKDAVNEGLKDVSWKGRMEVMNMQPYVVLDGAHNIDGIEKLCKGIDTYFKYKRLYLIIGILADKQVEEMLRLITPKAKIIIAVTPNSERAEQAEVLKNRIVSFNSHCEAASNYEEAVRRGLLLCNEDDILVICGSLYMIGDMRKILKRIF
jgi:dihydrofolate synthase/folylpolyglutamate synthase